MTLDWKPIGIELLQVPWKKNHISGNLAVANTQQTRQTKEVTITLTFDISYWHKSIILWHTCSITFNIMYIDIHSCTCIYIYINIYIWMELNWPPFFKVNPPKQPSGIRHKSLPPHSDPLSVSRHQRRDASGWGKNGRRWDHYWWGPSIRVCHNPRKLQHTPTAHPRQSP